MRMLVDIFIAPVGPSQAPKMEPVVPNLMSASIGSNPARAGAVVAAKAAVETTKRRRLSMAFSPVLLGRRLYQARGPAKRKCAGLRRNKSAKLRVSSAESG